MTDKGHIIIIAEAGVNHNGNLNLAKKMIEEAKKAGADYVKFQTFIPKELVTAYAPKADYQNREAEKRDSQLEMLQNLALDEEAFIELKKHCDRLGIGFLSTPFDMKSIDFLAELDMDYWKIPSGEITNLPYLEKIAKTRKNVILSTGMSEMDEIREAVDILERNGASEIMILHCNTEYPTPFADVNLTAMKQIENDLNKQVGYSDHTEGIEVPIAAAALGAKIIEKHFTLDRKMEGPDHQASLEPGQLTDMVRAIRHIEDAIGNGKKMRTASERCNVDVVRKSIVASKDIHTGEIFTEDNITVKRPGNGISPMKWYQVLGQKATRDYKTDEFIKKE